MSVHKLSGHNNEHLFAFTVSKGVTLQRCANVYLYLAGLNVMYMRMYFLKTKRTTYLTFPSIEIAVAHIVHRYQHTSTVQCATKNGRLIVWSAYKSRYKASPTLTEPFTITYDLKGNNCSTVMQKKWANTSASLLQALPQASRLGVLAS